MAEMTPEYRSKSIEEVIHDLRDDRFWRLANPAATKGTRLDAANMLEKLCAAVQADRERIGAALAAEKSPLTYADNSWNQALDRAIAIARGKEEW